MEYGTPHLQFVWAIIIVWRIRGKIIRTVLRCVQLLCTKIRYTLHMTVLKVERLFKFTFLFVWVWHFCIFFCFSIHYLVVVFLWPPCVIEQVIIFFPCGFFLSFYLSFFSSPRSQRSQIGCLPYFYTWRGPSADLECRSKMCCSRLAANTGRKKVAKNRHLGTIAQLRRAKASQLRHVSTIGKKTC